MANTSNIKSETARRHTDLTGQFAVVTGGTKGIGKACVEELAALGAKVLTCSRKEDDIAEAVKAWTAQGLDVQGTVADVSSPEGRKALVEKVKEVFKGQLHILVNNAGTNVRRSTAAYTEEEYHFIIRTNLDSAFLLTKALYPQLKAPGSASVVFIGSIAGGPTTVSSGSAYAVTKAALDQFSRYIACEWAQDGIRVNSIKPGYVITPLTKDLMEDVNRHKNIISRVPMRRVGQPEEIAGLTAFLATPAASYITGQCLAIDGGFSGMGLWPIDDVIPFPSN